MSKHFLFFIFINTLIIILLAWNTFTRFNDFKNHHVSLANESVRSLAYEVSNFINERQRFVALFVQENKQLVEQLIDDPENVELKTLIENKLHSFFPRYFTFTIADNDGNPYLVDFEGQVGQLCNNDIAKFSRTNENKPQIHPGVDAYHFDIMTSLKSKTREYIFFVSFHAATLGQIIKNIEIPYHRLELILDNETPLLEVNSKGPRNMTPRDDYRLTEEELKYVLASVPVENSRWQAIDAQRPGLLMSYLYKTVLEAFIFVLVSVVITAFFYLRIKKEESLRIVAENSKNEFLSMISHELRTPLTSIYGAISLLADTNIREDSAKSSHMLDLAKRNCNQLLNLINEILDFRKIETGNIEYDFQRVELNNLIEEAIDAMEDYALQFGSKIIYQEPGTTVYINADSNRIIQVLNNLLSNAIKYGAKNDTVKVDVDLSADTVRVNVHDNGPGIPDEFADKLFDKFTQTHISSKTSGSAGLGLNIAKRFINDHDGIIDFTSSPEGTTFYFELPVYQEQE